MSSTQEPNWRHRRRRLDFTRIRLERSVELDGQAVLVTDAPALVPVETIDGWQEGGQSVVVFRLELPQRPTGRPWRLSLSATGQEVACDAR